MRAIPAAAAIVHCLQSVGCYFVLKIENVCQAPEKQQCHEYESTRIGTECKGTAQSDPCTTQPSHAQSTTQEQKGGAHQPQSADRKLVVSNEWFIHSTARPAMCLSHHLSQVHKDHSVPVQCSPVTSDCTALPYENNSAAAAARHPELQAGWGVRETVPHNLLTSITSDAVITKALWLHVQMELKQEMDKKSERKKRQQGKKEEDF